jgi:hypothetical protein
MKGFFEVTHANHEATPIVVDARQFFAAYYSTTHKCTLLLASGGAMMPVKETVDQVKEKVRACLTDTAE